MPDLPPDQPKPKRRASLRTKAAGRRPDRTAVVSHEIRGPLGVITALSELLLTRDLPTADRHVVELIRLAGHHLSAVAEDLVAEASLGADSFRTLPAPFAPADTLRAIAALYAPLTVGTAKQLDVEIADDLPGMIVSDESRVRQVLFNLVSNASKYMSAGRILLRLRRGGADTVVFEVLDEGPGIPVGFVPRPFAGREDASAPGAGLGLWISARIATALNGDLRLERRPEGGTAASLQVPVGAAAPIASTEPAAAGIVPDSARPASPRRRRRATDRKTVPVAAVVARALVVDDSPVSRMLMSTILGSFGIEVEACADGVQALHALANAKPDIILLDWTLAHESGADVLESLAGTVDSLPPVIAVSGNLRPTGVEGLAGWLTKPFTPRELYAAIERAAFGTGATVNAGA
ncbi:hybrid sensor histidine kinase/response regulator [Chthonobacter albigriseus]|uniref:hybrid sensor histidine kinase/response regulator n=1 Tax=Chthonobacter albigriseus TaxID=1683161 RepID=UPI0015EF6842|nr:hybrid sensor histidine kinase/response regulator [Chthonobacter albigriseus]